MSPETALEGLLVSGRPTIRPVVEQARYHVRAGFDPSAPPGEATMHIVLNVWCAECSCDVPRWGSMPSAMSQLDLRMTMQDHDRRVHTLAPVDYPVVLGG